MSDRVDAWPTSGDTGQNGGVVSPAVDAAAAPTAPQSGPIGSLVTGLLASTAQGAPLSSTQAALVSGYLSGRITDSNFRDSTSLVTGLIASQAQGPQLTPTESGLVNAALGKGAVDPDVAAEASAAASVAGPQGGLSAAFTLSPPAAFALRNGQVNFSQPATTNFGQGPRAGGGEDPGAGPASSVDSAPSTDASSVEAP
jgi:hypothetical protein